MIRILSNGSKWAGEAPDSIEKLLEVLGKYPLDRTMAKYHFIQKSPKFCEDFYKELGTSPEQTYTFSGNFFALSHVFEIVTDEPETIQKLTKAIRKNMRRSDYLSQKG